MKEVGHVTVFQIYDCVDDHSHNDSDRLMPGTSKSRYGGRSSESAG